MNKDRLKLTIDEDIDFKNILISIITFKNQ